MYLCASSEFEHADRDWKEPSSHYFGETSCSKNQAQTILQPRTPQFETTGISAQIRGPEQLVTWVYRQYAVKYGE